MSRGAAPISPAMHAPCAALLLSTMLAATAAADDVVRPAAAGPGRPPLEMLEPGVDDIGPARLSLRFMPYEMRLPTGFERVYRVPGSDDLLMRGNGALFAVFPRSVYIRTARGATAVAPPGTVFHIGMPGPTPVGILREKAAEQRAHASPARVDLLRDGRMPLEETMRFGAAPAPEAASRAPAPQAAPTMRPVFPPDPESTRDPFAHLALGPARVER